MALFDAYVMADWSAAASPTKGKDSIWIGVARPGHDTTVENISTRLAARGRLHALAAEAIKAGERLLIGFDFPFGYPAGVAKHITGQASAMTLWHWIAGRIKDGSDNANNRFEVASELNRLYPGIGPFWGRPASWDFPEIPTTEKARTKTGHPPERRLADSRAKGAKTVWQLAYAGSVGSQVLMGLPHVLTLRQDPELAPHTGVWPFETGLVTPKHQVVLAEIYPSLIPPDPSEAIKDAGQVRATADWLAGLDRDGALEPLFAGPPDASAAERSRIVSEEAWILGLEAPAVRSVGSGAAQIHLPGASTPKRLRYERDPAEIQRQAIAAARKEADLDHLPDVLRDVAIQMVQACGMPDITARLAWSSDVGTAAQKALAAGAPILTDCAAVAALITRDDLPSANEVICTLHDLAAPGLAKDPGTTATAAAVDLWRDRIDGAVVAIGNAPTALFHLLERLDKGWPRPAAILAFPVGLVGAAEAKAELANDPRGTPFLTLRGRRGGTAMAAAAVAAFAQGSESAP